MKKILLILLLIPMLFCMSCRENKISDNPKPTVAVAIAPMSEFVKAVCGDKVNVLTILPTGASPETYEPDFSVMKELENAEIYFSLGLSMEENFIIKSLNKTTVVEVFKAVSKEYPDIFEGEHRDPHIWLSVKRVEMIVNEIAKSMSKAYPENGELYFANAEKYINELKKLNEYNEKLFQNKTNKSFIVFHPAFAYLAEEYSLSMYSLEEHGKEITAKNLVQMIDLAKKEKITTIFYQVENSAKQPISFANEIGGSAVMLDPLADDYIENMKNMCKKIAEAMK